MVLIQARAVEDFVLKHPVKTKVTKETTAIPSETESQPPSKRMKIMSFLEETKNFLGEVAHKDSSKKTAFKQLNEYLDLVKTNPVECQDTRSFWKKYRHEWPELAAYAKALLTVPASSASVERVFSVGGAILRHSRRRLSDRLFEMIMFLKCYLHLFKNLSLL